MGGQGGQGGQGVQGPPGPPGAASNMPGTPGPPGPPGLSPSTSHHHDQAMAAFAATYQQSQAQNQQFIMSLACQQSRNGVPEEVPPPIRYYKMTKSVSIVIGTSEYVRAVGRAKRTQSGGCVRMDRNLFVVNVGSIDGPRHATRTGSTHSRLSTLYPAWPGMPDALISAVWPR